MGSLKLKKRLVIILSIVVLAILIAIFSINFILATIIKGKVNNALEKNNTEYKVEIDGVGGNIFFGNIRLKGITVKPDSSLFNKLKEGLIPSGKVYDIELPLFRIAGLEFYDAIIDGKVDIRKIEFRDADIKIYTGPKPDLPKEKESAKEPITFDPDSIYLQDVNGVSIGALILEDNQVQFIDIESNEVVVKNRISYFEFTDFYLVQKPEFKNVFKLVVDDFKLMAKNEEFNMPGGDYIIGFDGFEFAMTNRTLVIGKFKLKPTFKDKFKMAAQWKYTKEIYDLEVEEIRINNIDTYKLVTENSIFIDSLTISELDVKILKDKRYPFNESLRPKLPNELLRTMELPLYVGEVNIHKSKLKYQEKEEWIKDMMTVSLGNLNVKVSHATSVKDSIRTGKPMKIKLRAKLMGKVPLKVDFRMPLNSRVDTFFFTGSLGGSQLSTFNSASYPSLGAKFVKGKLNSIHFKGSANKNRSAGEFTMLYENLVGELVKKDLSGKNKFVSWAANSVLRKGNPGKNGKTRVAMLNFERVMYKGFGNFMWKTLQSGITHSIIPGGKQVKENTSETNKSNNVATEKKEKNRKRRTKKNNK